MTEIEKLKKVTGEQDEELLQLLYDDATEYVLSYTGRTKLAGGLSRAVRELAVIALNRMGTEGESARSEGGENYTFNDAPTAVYETLKKYRLARCGGHAFETE